MVHLQNASSYIYFYIRYKTRVMHILQKVKKMWCFVYMQIYLCMNSVWWQQNITWQSLLQSVSTAYKIITHLLFRWSTGGEIGLLRLLKCSLAIYLNISCNIKVLFCVWQVSVIKNILNFSQIVPFQCKNYTFLDSVHW